MSAVRCKAGVPWSRRHVGFSKAAMDRFALTSGKPGRSIISWTEEIPVVDSDLSQKGLRRKRVLGEKYVDATKGLLSALQIVGSAIDLGKLRHCLALGITPGSNPDHLCACGQT
jgi:hypothetical protein